VSGSRICTNTNHVGDRFNATVTQAVVGSNGAVIPAGATASVEVTALKRSDRDRLDDIADAITAIRAHSKRRTDERLKRDALLYNLMIVGEAVKAISDETKARQPEIPWREIAGLRDLLAHEYYQIELGVIEDIVTRDLAPLATAVAALRRASKP